jgi:hypothetical protein
MRASRWLASLSMLGCAFAQQAPWGRANIPLSTHDRVYADLRCLSGLLFSGQFYPFEWDVAPIKKVAKRIGRWGTPCPKQPQGSLRIFRIELRHLLK